MTVPFAPGEFWKINTISAPCYFVYAALLSLHCRHGRGTEVLRLVSAFNGVHSSFHVMESESSIQRTEMEVKSLHKPEEPT